MEALVLKMGFPAVAMKAKRTFGTLWVGLGLGLAAVLASHLRYSHSLTIDCIPHPGQPSSKCPLLGRWCG